MWLESHQFIQKALKTLTMSQMDIAKIMKDKLTNCSLSERGEKPEEPQKVR